jgi:hypothetical protein
MNVVIFTGVTMTVADPCNCAMYQIPIGLINQVEGHGTQQVAEITLKLMHAFGFSQANLNATVNDNTNLAILAGKYLLGKNTGGQM